MTTISASVAGTLREAHSRRARRERPAGDGRMRRGHRSEPCSRSLAWRHRGGGQPGAPIVVSCEPNQRTLVRPVVVNGAAVSQVECITNGSAPIAAQPFRGPGVVSSYRQVPRRSRISDRGYDRGDDLGDARVIPVSQPADVARPIPARQVVYTGRPTGAQEARGP